MEPLFIQIANEHDGVTVNFYNGKVSLVSANEGAGGKVWMRFAFPQDKEKEPRRPAVPMGVRLGTPDTAARILRQCLAYIEKNLVGQPASTQPPPGGRSSVDDDDIPF